MIFGGNRSLLVHWNSLNIRSEIWGQFLNKYQYKDLISWYITVSESFALEQGNTYKKKHILSEIKFVDFIDACGNFLV